MAEKQAADPELEIGIQRCDRGRMAQGLSALPADSHTLHLMTPNFHWNVTEPQFDSLQRA